MTVTYTTAAERERRQRHTNARTFDGTDALFFATSVVCVLAVALAYAGRTRTIPTTDSSSPIVLTATQRPDIFEGALRDVLPAVRDRQFAAQELARAVADTPARSVRAVLAARIPGERIARANLVRYADRLRQASPTGTAADRPLTAIPLFTEVERDVVARRFVVRDLATFRTTMLGWFVGYLAAFQLVWWLWRLMAIAGDRVLLAAAHLLTALGFALLVSLADPLRDELLIPRFALGVMVGLVGLTAASRIDLAAPGRPRLTYSWLLAAIGLSVLLLVFGSGPGASRAKVNLGPIQPIEAIRVCLALFLAGYFAKVWELLRHTRETEFRGRDLPRWLRLPRLDYLAPVVVGVAAVQGLFFLQRDLGPALLVSVLSLALYGVARARWPLTLAGAAALVCGFYLGARWHISETLAARVAMWRAPWENHVSGGDQVSGAVWALATGGTFGAGLGLGQPRYIRAGQNDLILAAAGEELGFAGLCVVALVFAAVAWRGLSTALRARDDYRFFVATALTLSLVTPALVMAAGIVGAIPLTGLVTPFLSDGGSAMVANLSMLGALAGIRQSSGGREPAVAAWTRPFRTPLTMVATVLLACGVALTARYAWVQLVRADDYAVRAHLGPQGDGVRRYQYNPRVLDFLRDVPRGNVLDRRGVPLATSDSRLIERSGATFRALGLQLPAPCLDGTSRCYPLDKEAFHLLGDTTQVNWTATNTAYIERDEEARLRGFDDHASLVATTDGDGRRTVALKRDHRDLVPLLRHRHEPNHPALVAFRQRNRNVRLTLDARLQHAVATRVAGYARRSTTGRAAAVVIDPSSGHILAQVSYPWPTTPAHGGAAPEATAVGAAASPGLHRGDGPLLDRARFGSYPPGSAFKLVTATAALRSDLRLAQEQFTCSRLDDGRVGVRIPGTRPVRDDVLDTHPHGTINLQAGLVHSCNAYFAQLALQLGPEALLDTAARYGVSVVSGGQTAARLRGTLAQAGYGQGEVLVSPLRMARVAAAIAADGVLKPDMLVDRGDVTARDEVLLPPAAAALLGRYMREAVLSGTGRALRSHPARVAGKTGTAEVAGKPSHSWFVGFAPYGQHTNRIAFAVLVENAGYGGQAAASLAGDIVTAAAALGLAR